jgi:hypothetical protein
MLFSLDRFFQLSQEPIIQQNCYCLLPVCCQFYQFVLVNEASTHVRIARKLMHTLNTIFLRLPGDSFIVLLHLNLSCAHLMKYLALPGLIKQLPLHEKSGDDAVA